MSQITHSETLMELPGFSPVARKTPAETIESLRILEIRRALSAAAEALHGDFVGAAFFLVDDAHKQLREVWNERQERQRMLIPEGEL